MRCFRRSDRPYRTAARSRRMPRQPWTVRPLLIVDEDRAFTEAIGRVLAPRGYACLAVDAAERAAAMLRNPPDGGDPAPVVLIDAHLGGSGSGIDLISLLRREHPELICVSMAAGIDTRTGLAALRRGAYDYFDKACEPDALFAALERCFDRVALHTE